MLVVSRWAVWHSHQMSFNNLRGFPSSAAIIVIASTVLLAVHITLRLNGKGLGEGLDVVTLGISGVALSPFFARFLRSMKIGGVELTFIEETIKLQGQEIEQLKFVVANFLSAPEATALQKIASNQPFIISIHINRDAFQAELRRLRALGFIETLPDCTIAGMYSGEGSERNVQEYFKVTEKGFQYLKMLGSDRPL